MWVVTCAVRQLCADINYDRHAKQHDSLHETTVLMYSEVRRHVFCGVTELELWCKVASWTHTTDVIIHSKSTCFNGIMMFCIAVIFDVSAQLGRLLTSRLSSRLLKKVMTEHTCNEILTFCIYVGDDISIPVERHFHYSIANSQYFVIPVSFHWVPSTTLINETGIT